MSDSSPTSSHKKRESKVLNDTVDTLSTKIDLSKASDDYRRSEVAMSNVKFHSILRKLMNEKNISSRALAKKLGIPHSTLSSYLSGKKASYSADHIGVIANYFEVSSDYLLFGKENDLSALNESLLEEIFSGWLKVRIERAIPHKKKFKIEEE